MSDRMQANRTLLRQIIAIHEKSHETYGSPRVVKALKKDGVACSEKRVARLMQKAHLQGRVVRVTRRAPGVQRFYERHANLRLGKPAPSTVNQQWVADVTFLRVQGQQCFLAAIMDVYSRKILGWSWERPHYAAHHQSLHSCSEGSYPFSRLYLPFGPRR